MVGIAGEAETLGAIGSRDVDAAYDVLETDG